MSIKYSDLIRESGLTVGQVASEMGIRRETLSRKLKRGLSDSERVMLARLLNSHRTLERMLGVEHIIGGGEGRRVTG